MSFFNKCSKLFSNDILANVSTGDTSITVLSDLRLSLDQFVPAGIGILSLKIIDTNFTEVVM